MEGVVTGFPFAGSTNYTNSKREDTLPDQTQAWSKKYGDNSHIKPFQTHCMDFFHTAWKDGAPERKRMQLNYRLANGLFDFKDTGNYTNILQINTPTPGVADLTPGANSLGELKDDNVFYPIGTLPLKSLWGEEASAPFNWRMKAENPEATNEYLRQKTDLMQTFANSRIQQEMIKKYGEDVIQEQDKYQQVLDLNGIEDHSKRKFRPQGEKAGNVILNNLIKEISIISKLTLGWKHATIVAREFFWIGSINGSTVLEVVNPLSLVYSKAYDIQYLHEADWVTRGEYMTPTQIVEYKRHSLNEKQVKDIMNYNVYGSNNLTSSNEGSAYYNYAGGAKSDLNAPGGFVPTWDQDVNGNYDSSSLGLFDGGSFMNSNDTSRVSPRFRTDILVIHAEWNSKKKMCNIRIPDPETGEIQTLTIDGEHFDLDDPLYSDLKAMGAECTYFWMNEVWEGTKIGNEIYLDIQPKDNQFRSINKPNSTKLGYTGTIFNNLNAIPISPLDEIKEFWVLYNIVANDLRKNINKNLGNLLLVDMNQIYTKGGWTYDKTIYNAKETGILLIDPEYEGKKPGSSVFNQFQMLQSSLDAYMREGREFLNYLEQKCWQQAGFTPQRLGDVKQGETATGTNAAISKSYSQTAYYFYIHNELKRHVLQMVLEEAKFNLKDTISTTYYLDDMTQAFIEISPELKWEDLSIWISDYIRDQEAHQFGQRLSEVAINRGAPLIDAYEMATNDSTAIIKERLQNLKDYQQQVEQNAQKLEQAKIDSGERMHQADLDRQDANLQLDRENKIQLKEMDVLSAAALGSKDTDIDDNGVPDVYEMGKLQIDQSKLNFESSKHQRELQDKDNERSSKEKIKDKELKQKDKELKMKKDVEDKKNKQIETQNKSQERMQDKELKDREKDRKANKEIEEKKLKAKDKELQIKVRIEKLKIKAKPKPKPATKKK